MAKKVITSLNIKNSDNTFTNVPIGIKAENVKLKNNRDLETSTAFLEDVEDASEFEAQKTPLYQEDVIDNLSTSTDNPISAKQGVILNARINNLAGFNGNVSDKEIVDLRVGADGKTYSTAGTAVRENFNILRNQDLKQKEDLSKKVDGKDSNGTWVIAPDNSYYPSIKYLEINYSSTDEVKNLIAQAKIEPTEFEELTDLRVGADGKVYQTAGVAVRKNIQNVNKKVDDYDKTQVQPALKKKADKADTLAGYGITDAYDKTYINRALKLKLDAKPFDTVPTKDSPNYITSGTLYNSVNTLNQNIAKKYDSSNIESGTGELSPAQTIYEGCTGKFDYVKNGKVVTVSVNITKLVADKSYIQMAGLPFPAKSESRFSSIAVYSTTNKLRNIRLDGSWLYISSPTDKFTEDEKINFTTTYIRQGG